LPQFQFPPHPGILSSSYQPWLTRTSSTAHDRLFRGGLSPSRRGGRLPEGPLQNRARQRIQRMGRVGRAAEPGGNGGIPCGRRGHFFRISWRRSRRSSSGRFW
jgi:hypothetical protein